MLCEFCGKVIKSEKAFAKHHCLQMDIFNNFDNSVFDLYFLCVTAYGNKNNIKADMDAKIEFGKSKKYIFFQKLKTFLIDNGLYDDARNYFRYILSAHIKQKDWMSDNLVAKYIKYRAIYETPAIAVVRSMRFMESHNLKLDDLTNEMVFDYLNDGWLSKHYFKQNGIDVKQILTVEQQQDLSWLI